MTVRHHLAAALLVVLGTLGGVAGAAVEPPRVAHAAAPPAVSSVSVTRRVVAPQGHARLLVGARLASQATMIVKIVRNGRVLRQAATPRERGPGRAYLLIEAVDGRGFQLAEGDYLVTVQARSATGALSTPVTARTTLDLGGPLGQIDLIVAPTWAPIARQLGANAGAGMAVGVVATGGAAAKAGIKRGDVIVSINTRAVPTAGAWRSATAALPAATPIPVEILRAGQPVSTQVTLVPDWTPAPSYGPALAAALKKEPSCLACRYAQTRIEIDAEKPANAAGLLAKWPRALRNGFVGQMATGEIALARGDGKTALSAFQRAAAAEPTVSGAFHGQGLALTLLGQFAQAVDVLAQGSALDPADAEILAARAFALLRLDRIPDAAALATQALSTDPTSANARIAQGIALIASGSTPDGLASLREGIRQLEDPSRAAAVISKNLEPNDP